MLIWKKLGILGLVIPLGLAIALQLLLGDHANYAGIGYLVGAIIVWYFGKKWNGQIEKEYESDLTMKRISKHSLFWIHLENWGIFFGILGITILFSENIFELGTDPELVVWGIGLIVMIFYQIYKNYHKDRRHEMVLDSPEYSKANKPKAKKELGNKANQTINKTQKEYKTLDHTRYMPKPNKEK